MQYDLGRHEVDVQGDETSGTIFINKQWAGNYWRNPDGSYKAQNKYNERIEESLHKAEKWIVSRFQGVFTTNKRSNRKGK